jgi:hypothetical protein
VSIEENKLTNWIRKQSKSACLAITFFLDERNTEATNKTNKQNPIITIEMDGNEKQKMDDL